MKGFMCNRHPVVASRALTTHLKCQDFIRLTMLSFNLTCGTSKYLFVPVPRDTLDVLNQVVLLSGIAMASLTPTATVNFSTRMLIGLTDTRVGSS
ncbi:MAG: hypothetical protein DFNUSKGM_001193 [Candidatus Fervidibacter sacchari]